MAAGIDVLDPAHPKRVLLVASNPTVSKRTGWPIGFWWAELTHPYWELSQLGYEIDVASPDGGALEGDSWSDPRDGLLITGQQQYSGAAVARLIVGALGR